ncbi:MULTISPECIES: amino acid racemase [unclassified Halomonas]|uniref:aspartate/glutamate racemase family protein n=1 Tax=unclassified Halomonas TaxID=2609666 RepID=UPI0019656E52|nr:MULTISPECIES: amino acid racemase [unclassified Halomonas]|tara:strand:+ start:2997 stop:3737 length:741 start_codon:yes stop_codon:yes gene_type:complete
MTLSTDNSATIADHTMVGVLGGMGPDATVAFMQKVIEVTPGEDDIDHVHMLVDNNPKVPSRIKALIDGDGESPAPAIAAMARRLEQAGCDFLVMPCNTAHYYWSAAQQAVDIPVWHIVERTLDRVAAEMPGARVGMLCSPALRKIGLYEGFIEPRGLSLVYPDNEDRVLDVIRAVKRGAGRAPGTHAAFIEAAHDVQARGADVLVLACTELSVIRDALDGRVPIIDTVQVLAEDVVAEATGKAPRA